VIQAVEVADGLHHIEQYTATGLLTVLWHGDPADECAVITVGGAMGSLLGPAGGLYHHLGSELAARGVGTLRVGYRQPELFEQCVEDALDAAALASEHGARRFVVVGHSFGGAVALNAAVGLGAATVGVVTLSTQAGGCEPAESLDGTPVLHIHGEDDEILPAAASSLVQMLTNGRLVVVPGGHLLSESAEQVQALVAEFVIDCFERKETDADIRA